MIGKRLFLVIFLTMIFIAASSLPSFAGWVQINKSGQKSIISNGKLKSGSGDGWMLIDTDHGTMTMVNTRMKSYMSGTPAEICKQIDDMQKAMLERFPPEQRAMMEKMMNKQKDGAKTDVAHKVSIVKSGSGGKVAGFDTNIYSVIVDGKKTKEIWHTTGATPASEFKSMEKVLKMGKEFTACTSRGPGGSNYDPEDSAEYMKLFKSGWVLKEARGGKVTQEAVSLTKKNIAETEFAIPAGFKKTTFAEMMQGMQQQGMQGRGRGK